MRTHTIIPNKSIDEIIELTDLTLEQIEQLKLS